MKKINHNQIIALILIIIGMTVIFEIVRNNMTLLFFIFGLLGLFISNRLFTNKSKFLTILSLFFIGLAMLSTVSAWVFVSLIIVIIFSQNQSLFRSLKVALFESDFTRVKSEYFSIRFDKQLERPAKRTKNQWFGRETDENNIYQWEDINYTKFAGDTLIDLGNTIIPKEQNLILIRKGFGNIKILVPEEVAVSLNLSVLLGRVQIGEDELVLNNEVITFRSDRYDTSSRQLKVVASVLLGDIEVVFI